MERKNSKISQMIDKAMKPSVSQGQLLLMLQAQYKSRKERESRQRELVGSK